MKTTYNLIKKIKKINLKLKKMLKEDKLFKKLKILRNFVYKNMKRIQIKILLILYKFIKLQKKGFK